MMRNLPTELMLRLRFRRESPKKVAALAGIFPKRLRFRLGTWWKISQRNSVSAVVPARILKETLV